MSDAVLARVDLGALRHNVARVRAFAPGRAVYAAIKSDGYGHGALPVARALRHHVDGFAVARLEEALKLREGGMTGVPILLLSERLGAAAIESVIRHELEPLLYQPGQLQRLQAHGAAGLRVWVKIDSGMHRLGFPVTQAAEVLDELRAAPGLTLAGWVTHLACADDVHSPMTERQVRVFSDAVERLPGVKSIANSAGVVAWPGSHADMVRPGIMLYGASPLLDQSAQTLGLRPAMTLTTSVISIQRLETGETVGYGATWQACAPATIAVAGIGYGDGYPRHAGSGTPVLVNGQRCELAGRVSMDMITIRIPDGMPVAVGDPVTLWGEGLPADEVARAAGTIAYELFCRLSARVRFSYADNEATLPGESISAHDR